MTVYKCNQIDQTNKGHIRKSKNMFLLIALFLIIFVSICWTEKYSIFFTIIIILYLMCDIWYALCIIVISVGH